MPATTAMETPSNGSSMMNGGGPEAENLSSSRFLHERFPVNTVWDLTLESEEVVQGRVYCTDEASRTVVIQKPLTHTTLAQDVRIINAERILHAVSHEEDSETAKAMGEPTPLSSPLPKLQKKALDEKEKKAIRTAEESLRHINQKATPEGQAIFDRLLKACNQVEWKEESILVLNQIQVDPPYGPDDCKIVQRNANGKKTLEDGSLGRVKKIVAAAASTSSTVVSPT